VPSETTAWARGGPSWDEQRRFAKLVSPKDVVRTVLGAIFYASRQSALILAGIAIFSASFDAMGFHAAALPRWAWIAGLIGVAVAIPLDARRMTAKLALVYALILSAGAVTVALGIPWWLTWALLSLVIVFFTVTGTMAVLAVLGHSRASGPS
jgi:hypothetical protein